MRPPPSLRTLPSRRPRGARFALAALLAGATGGCNTLDGFTTAPGESYCGAVTLGSAFREGFSPTVQMRLTLDTAALEAGQSPGTLWTYEAPEGNQGERRLLEGAPVRPLPALAHDPLSHLDFGEGRERNWIGAVSPSDPAAESMLVVVSLKTDGTVEVRLLRGGLLDGGSGSPPPEGRKQLFGLFPLARQKGTCGF